MTTLISTVKPVGLSDFVRSQHKIAIHLDLFLKENENAFAILFLRPATNGAKGLF